MKKLFGIMAVLFIASSADVFAQEYKVGDTGPAGGLIFFDKGALTNGWRYLEAAPVDEVNESVFSNVYEEIGTTKTGIGEGKANTKAIISQAGHKESAAKLCDDLEVTYNGKSFNDYFLPSKDELNLMHKNLYSSDKGNFSRDYYWCSSEGGFSYAWAQDFANGHSYDGAQYYDYKNFSSAVRCARAF